jgi:hypothetical protein
MIQKNVENDKTVYRSPKSLFFVVDTASPVAGSKLGSV